jgi:hypothetical protein
LLRAAVVIVALLAGAVPAAAQRVEVSPFGGYRFGASLVGISGAYLVDDDGGVSFGAALNVRIGEPLDGIQFEALFSREQAQVRVRTSPLLPYFHAPIEVDHMMVGGLQELDAGPARPYIGGLVGISRFASPDDTELRFTIGLSAGGKFFATRNFGVRVDARGYKTIASLGGGAGVCSGGCFFAFNVVPAFQADLTAGLIVAF